MKSFLTSAPRLFAPLAFFAIRSTTTRNTRMVVTATAANSSSGYQHNFLATTTIPSSFVLPNNIMSSCISSSSNIIGGGNRRRHRHHHQPHDLLSNPTITHDGLMIQSHRRFCLRQYHVLSMSSDNQNDNNNNNNPFNDDEPTQSPSGKDNNSNNNNNNMVVIDELSWRIAKLRLEEANTKQLLNRKPLKMSYLQSRQFIQRNWGPIRSQKNLRTWYPMGIYEHRTFRNDRKNIMVEEENGLVGSIICWVSVNAAVVGGGGGIGTNNSTDTSSGGDGGGGRSQDVVLKWQ